jgi:hypothetical protein
MYTPDPSLLASATPGQILASTEIQAPAGMRVWALLYASTGLDGSPIAVSGLVAVPRASPPQEGFPVIGFAHGTSGLADLADCVPSWQGAPSMTDELAVKVLQGFVVVATDYEALGTDGIHPYAVGLSEGRSVLDAVRAALAFEPAHAGAAILFGQSQGGRAVLWAGELASTYAPELDIRGVLAAAPGADLAAHQRSAFENAEAGNPAEAIGALIAYGAWSEIYGLSLDFLTDEGREVVDGYRTGCDLSIAEGADPYRTDSGLLPEWAARIEENTPGHALTEIPILMAVGDADGPEGFYDRLHRRLCDAGDTVEYLVLPGDHEAGLIWALGNMGRAWFEARVNNEPANGCNA